MRNVKILLCTLHSAPLAGRTSPKKAVAAAKKEGVRIYTIGIGAKGDYDAALLKIIAKETGARSYHALDADALKELFAQIATLEPSPIRVEAYLGKQLLIAGPIMLAGILLRWWTLSAYRKERE